MRDRVLVTGATGFIGGRLAEMLMQSGAVVRLLVRNPQALRGTLRECDIVQGDLGDDRALSAAAEGVDLVYHCAANVATWDSLPNYLEVNVEGLAWLLQAVSANAPELRRFVHFSTVDVYGYPDQPCDEQCPTPSSRFGYGESKRRGEQLLRDYAAKHALPYTILRPCNVIGPGSQFVERIGKELKHGLMLSVDGGSANAGLVYIDNLVEYAICLAYQSRAVGETFNLRDPYDVTWSTFMDDLGSAIQGKGRVVNLPFRLADSVGSFLAGVHRSLGIKREPLLHPLITRMFGKTCGHDAGKLFALCDPAHSVDYETAIQRSCDWFIRAAR